MKILIQFLFLTIFLTNYSIASNDNSPAAGDVIKINSIFGHVILEAKKHSITRPLSPNTWFNNALFTVDSDDELVVIDKKTWFTPDRNWFNSEVDSNWFTFLKVCNPTIEVKIQNGAIICESGWIPLGSSTDYQETSNFIKIGHLDI